MLSIRGFLFLPILSLLVEGFEFIYPTAGDIVDIANPPLVKWEYNSSDATKSVQFVLFNPYYIGAEYSWAIPPYITGEYGVLIATFYNASLGHVDFNKSSWESAISSPLNWFNNYWSIQALEKNYNHLAQSRNFSLIDTRHPETSWPNGPPPPKAETLRIKQTFYENERQLTTRRMIIGWSVVGASLIVLVCILFWQNRRRKYARLNQFPEAAVGPVQWQKQPKYLVHHVYPKGFREIELK